MASSRNILAACALATLPCIALAQAQYPKDAPAEGEVPYGKIILVDDGTCPAGQVKEITGGSREKAIPRKVRCVSRPR